MAAEYTTQLLPDWPEFTAEILRQMDDQGWRITSTLPTDFGRVGLFTRSTAEASPAQTPAPSE